MYITFFLSESTKFYKTENNKYFRYFKHLEWKLQLKIYISRNALFYLIFKYLYKSISFKSGQKIEAEFGTNS